MNNNPPTLNKTAVCLGSAHDPLQHDPQLQLSARLFDMTIIRALERCNGVFTIRASLAYFHLGNDISLRSISKMARHEQNTQV